MRKIYALLGMAIMALSSVAQTSVGTLTLGEFNGDYSDDKAMFDGFNCQNAPVTFVYKHSGSQTIYLPHMLEPMKDKEITSIAFSCLPQDCYVFDYTSTMKLYLSEVAEENFVKDGNKYLWFVTDYTNPNASLDFKADFQEAATNEENILIKFQLEKPFKYTGKTLLVTVVNDGDQSVGGVVRFFLVKRKSKDEPHYNAIFGSDSKNFMEYYKESKAVTDGNGYRNAEPAAVQFTYQEPQVHTAVCNIEANESQDSNEWYNLQGVRIAQPAQAGIYIHNGKKVIVR